MRTTHSSSKTHPMSMNINEYEYRSLAKNGNLNFYSIFGPVSENLRNSSKKNRNLKNRIDF